MHFGANAHGRASGGAGASPLVLLEGCDTRLACDTGGQMPPKQLLRALLGRTGSLLRSGRIQMFFRYSSFNHLCICCLESAGAFQGFHLVRNCFWGEIASKRLSSLALFLGWKGRKLTFKMFYNDCDCFSCYRSIMLVSSLKLQHPHAEAATWFAVFGVVLEYFVDTGPVPPQSCS